MPATPTVDEWHVASAVLHCMRAHLPELRRRLDAEPGVCVHGSSETGKLVVTLEGPTADHITDAVRRLALLDGVHAAALVYQCSDTVAAMNEEMPDAQA